MPLPYELVLAPVREEDEGVVPLLDQVHQRRRFLKGAFPPRWTRPWPELRTPLQVEEYPFLARRLPVGP